MQNWNVISPKEIDHMPVEVATEMLASPKAKLSARMRKNCFAARQRVFESATPLHRGDLGIHDETIFSRQGRHLLQDYEHEQALANKPLANADKIRRLPLDRLGRLRDRSIRRRRNTQQAYEKLAALYESATDAQRKHYDKLRALLTIRAVQFDELTDAAETEIKIRAERAAEPRLC